MKHFCSLSEAIREGAKLRPQATQLFETLPSGIVGSCAYGAAYEALTGEITEMFCHDVYTAVDDLFPYVKSTDLLSCPIADCEECELEGLGETVLHLNDHHYWTREQIADWLESEEEKLGFVTLTESTASIETVQVAVSAERLLNEGVRWLLCARGGLKS